MFKTLILKEIHESILNFRFWLVSALCLLLIPFGLYIASKDYQSRLEEYQRELNAINEKQNEDQPYNYQAQGVFRPPVLSIISSGIKDYQPYTVKTSFDGYAKTEMKLQDSNLQSVLFGKIDFVFIITNFMSLLALIFTFGAISSEKEQGTLKLILSNSVGRWKLILAKITGNYLVFIAPFFVSIIIGVLIIQSVMKINILSENNFYSLLLILIFTMLFLFIFFGLGIWSSVISKNSIVSIVIILFIWIVISMGIPRISPMLAQVIYPVKSEDSYYKEYDILKSQITKEYKEEREVLFEKFIIDNHLQDNVSTRIVERTDCKELLKPIEEKYRQRLAKELGDFESAFINSRDKQMSIASNISRISPISSFTFMAAELCNTGLLELNNRKETSLNYQQLINNEHYSKFNYSEYSYKGSSGTSVWLKEVASENTKIPAMSSLYHQVSLGNVFQRIWPDLVILIWFTLFFFIGAVVSFLRFDVR